MVSWVGRFNSTAQRGEYKDLFQNYCELYYPKSTDYQTGPCPVFVESLFYVFDHIDPVMHCDQIGACDASTTLNTDIASTKQGGQDVFCNVCEQAVQQVKDQLNDPQVIDDMHKQADALCDYLKVIDADKECRMTIDKYLDQLIDFVRHMDPQKYCESLGVCKPNPLVVDGSLGAMQLPGKQYPVLADFNNFGLESTVKINSQVVKDIDSSAHPQPPMCKFCKVIVMELFKFLKDDRTEASVRNALDSICDRVYSNPDKRQQCEGMVKAYSRELIQLLVDETDPNMICTLIEQCIFPKAIKGAADNYIKTSTVSADLKPAEPIDLGTFISLLDSSVPPRSTRACLECKLFIKYLQNELDDPKSEEDIKSWLLNNLCETIEDDNTKKQCNDLIIQYTDIFFKAVKQSLNPQEACADLGACTKRHWLPIFMPAIPVRSVESTLSAIIVDLDPKVDDSETIKHPMLAKSNQSTTSTTPAPGDNNPVCDQCVEVVKQIDDYVSTHSLDQDVNVLIDQVCKKLPSSSLVDECTTIVRLYGTKIADYIAQMHNPLQVCQKIYLCSSVQSGTN